MYPHVTPHVNITLVGVACVGAEQHLDLRLASYDLAIGRCGCHKPSLLLTALVCCILSTFGIAVLRTSPTRKVLNYYITLNPIQLDVSNSVGDIQGIEVRSQSNVGLLGTVWLDQSVDVVNVDLVQLLNSRLDLVLVSLHGNLEN